MKYTMIIADDELLTLKSEELRITKKFSDIEIVGTAHDGISFKEMVVANKPDMAIVDIRMPGLNGIEAIKLLKDSGCETHFIVNTAYSDFEYVKAALDLKTDGFLVKPSKDEEFVSVITDICRLIDNEKKQQEDISKASSAIQLVSPIMGGEILLSVFSSQVDEEGFNLYCYLNSIHFFQGFIITLLPKYKGTALDKKKIRAVLKEILDGVCDYLETSTNDSIVVMIFIPADMKQDDITLWKREIVAKIKSDIELLMGITFICGVGDNYNSFKKMNDSYKKSLADFCENDQSDSESGSDKADSYIMRVKEYVGLHYAEDISLESCAEEIGVSTYYLSHLFKQVENRTFIDYLMSIRVEEAMRLCRETDFEIKEIAQRCGFNNISYFYRVFKKRTGITIGQYRESK
ncbi:MAG: helix-turn-helix domain-containing protein [Lachnospiraceae bacterium]|nr:helix-turn-helix domain-containing protein [Lachnospiraceae bacterium]